MNELVEWWSRCKTRSPELIWEPGAAEGTKEYGHFLVEFGNAWREHGSRVLRSLAADREHFLDTVSQAASKLDEWWAQIPESLCDSGRKAVSQVVATGSLFRALSGRTLPTPDEIDDEEDLEKQLGNFQTAGRKTLLSIGSPLCKAIRQWASAWQDRATAWRNATLLIPPALAIGAKEFDSAYCGSDASGMWCATESPTEAPWNSLTAIQQPLDNQKSPDGPGLGAEFSIYGFILDRLWSRQFSRLPAEVRRLDTDLSHNRWAAGIALCLATSPKKISKDLERIYKSISHPSSPFFEYFELHPSILAPHWIAQLRRAYDRWVTAKVKGVVASGAQVNPARWNEIDDPFNDPPFLLNKAIDNGELVTHESADHPSMVIQFLLDYLCATPTRLGTSRRHRGNDVALAAVEDRADEFGTFEIRLRPQSKTGKNVVVGIWNRQGKDEAGMPLRPIEVGMSDASVEMMLEAGKHGRVTKIDGRTFKNFADKFPGIEAFINRDLRGTRVSNAYNYSAKRVQNKVFDYCNSNPAT